MKAWKSLYKSLHVRKKMNKKALDVHFHRWQYQTEGLYDELNDDLDHTYDCAYMDDPCSSSGKSSLRDGSIAPTSLHQSPVKKRMHSAFKKLLQNVGVARNHQLLDNRIMNSKFVVNRQKKLKNIIFSTWLKQIRLEKEQRTLRGESLLRQEHISKLVNSIKMGGLSLAAESKGKQERDTYLNSGRDEIKSLRSEMTPTRSKSDLKKGTKTKNSVSSPVLSREEYISPLRISHNEGKNQDDGNFLIYPPRSPCIADDPRVRVVGSPAAEAKNTSPKFMRDSKAFDRDKAKDVEDLHHDDDGEYDDIHLPPPPVYTLHDTSQPCRKATPVSSSARKKHTRLVSAPVSDEQRKEEKIARKNELRERAKAIMTQRKLEDEMRRRRREEREEKEVERIKEERRLAREALNTEEKQKLRQQELAVVRMREKTTKAKKFYNMQLMVKYGIAPLRILLENSALNMSKADVFYADFLIKKYWCLLYGYTSSLKASRLRKEQRLLATATAHFSDVLLYRTMRQWKMRRKMLRAKAIAVSGQSNIFLKMKRGMNAWKVAYNREIRLYEKKLRDVSRRGNNCAMKYYWNIWNEHVMDERLEREIRVRSKHTWDKVRSFMSYK